MLEFLWSWGQQLDHYMSQITKIWQEGPDSSPHWRPLRFWRIWTPPLQQNRWGGHTAVLFCRRGLSPISSHVDTGTEALSHDQGWFCCAKSPGNLGAEGMGRVPQGSSRKEGMGLMKGWRRSTGPSQLQKADGFITLSVAGIFQSRGDWPCPKKPAGEDKRMWRAEIWH